MSRIVIEVSPQPKLEIQPSNAELVIEENISVVEMAPNVHEVHIDASEPTMLEISARGLRGPKGEPGADGAAEGATFYAVAGQSIHGDRVVMMVADRIYHPRLTDADHAQQCVGIAMQSGSIGSPLLVRSRGRAVDATWSWPPGFIWCGDDGVLTQVAPTSGWTLKVATAVNATTIEIDIAEPVIRS